MEEARTVSKWSYSVTCPKRPSAKRRAYSAFLIECIETASVIVSTRPELLPVINIRKLMKQPLVSIWRWVRRWVETHYRTQHWQFSSLKIFSNCWISCTASCSCRRSPPVLTMTDTQSQFAAKEVIRNWRKKALGDKNIPRCPYGEACRIRLWEKNNRTISHPHRTKPNCSRTKNETQN